MLIQATAADGASVGKARFPFLESVLACLRRLATVTDMSARKFGASVGIRDLDSIGVTSVRSHR